MKDNTILLFLKPKFRDTLSKPNNIDMKLVSSIYDICDFLS